MSAPRDRVNILMVDDQPAKLLSYETILSELGENLIRANSGNEALEYLLKMDIAVVLVDVCMPELDGFELATMIRNHPRFRKTAIILVSGVLVEDSDRLRGYDSGAVDYVSVPIIPEILRAKVSVFADLFRKSDQLQKLNRELERRVAERTAEIEAAAARLRSSEERLRLVLTQSGMRGWTWDALRDEVLLVSPSGESENVGPLGAFLASVHPADRPVVRESIDRALAGEREHQAEFRILDGAHERWLLGRGTVIRDAAGNPVSLAVVDVDICDRKRAEEERAALLRNSDSARREAETANRLKDEFLATLSHELRTPLNAITGWSHMLRANVLDDEGRRRAVEAIERNTQRQAKLIADILDVSRIVAGKLQLDVEAVHPRAILEAALETVGPVADAAGVTLEADLACPGEPIHGDPARLQQVACNLLSNAIKFTPGGGNVRLHLRCDAAQVAFTVEDDGPGIAPAFLPYLFERFRQGDASTTRVHHGLGLGLAIARHLVEMHGGRIEAANRTDRCGARFHVTLPRHGGVLGAAGAGLEGAPAERSVWLESAPSLAGIKVLVVDDEPDGREVVASALSLCQAQTTTAGSVREALAVIAAWAPTVVVSDIEMPVEDGYELLRRVRQLPADRGGRTPAVALTAYAATQDRMKILNAGFQTHVAKPVQPAELATIVANLVHGLPGIGG